MSDVSYKLKVDSAHGGDIIIKKTIQELVLFAHNLRKTADLLWVNGNEEWIFAHVSITGYVDYKTYPVKVGCFLVVRDNFTLVASAPTLELAEFILQQKKPRMIAKSWAILQLHPTVQC